MTRAGKASGGIAGIVTAILLSVFANDGVQVRATIVEGGVVNGVTGTWGNLNTSSGVLSISKQQAVPQLY